MLHNINALKEILLYREIESANNNTLRLKNGISIELYEEDYDWCAEASGHWIVADNFEGTITDVDEHYLTVTIFNNQNEIAQADAKADCGGSGYYYSILSVRVRNINNKVVGDFRLLDTD